MLTHFPEEVIQYCDDHTIRPDEVLDRIEKSTYANTNDPKMVSGSYQGRLLRMISQMLRPRRILEVGTFTGYSAVCMAAGLTEDGKLITLERDESLRPLLREHLSWTPLGQKIEVQYGDARELLLELEDTFDLVFIDAAKKQYGFYYEESLKRTRPGGVIIVDNVLWRGKVAQPDPDARTRSIQQFNDQVAADERVEPILLPIRDGVFVMRKKK